MGKIIYQMSVSLDGFFEGPERDLSWHRVDEELHQHFNDEIRPLARFLEGRVTYELMEDYWPTADQAPDASPATRDFAGIWREMPKTVYSRTLDKADQTVTIVREVVPDEVRALKDRSSGDLMLGGADLAETFLRHDLIDEYRIYVHPVVVGQGRRPFPALELDLHLTETRPFANGVVLLRYG